MGYGKYLQHFGQEDTIPSSGFVSDFGIGVLHTSLVFHHYLIVKQCSNIISKYVAILEFTLLGSQNKAGTFVTIPANIIPIVRKQIIHFQ